MAERRMFSKRIINSARFLKMPISCQALYFHLGLEADDDGVVEAYPVMNTTGATEDDLKVLVAKDFVRVLNEDLVTYITDWHENNKIRADRKVDSVYKNLLIQVAPDADIQQAKPRADTKKLTGQPMDVQWTTNGQPMDAIGKDSIGKNKEKKKHYFLDSYSKNEELISSLKDFIEMRKKIKAPMTERAVNLMLSKLSSMANDDTEKIKIINQSIMNSWKGIFPIKEEKRLQAPMRRVLYRTAAARDEYAAFFLQQACMMPGK